MSIPAGAIAEVQSGGSDTANGGFFDPSNTNMATDGAATLGTSNAPVFTSASCNSAAGDIGHYLFVKSGTNWNPGWYPITAQSGNGWVLNATLGAYIAYNPMRISTVGGCATVASPTGATWSIDYSQSTSPIALTGLSTSASNAIILTASARKCHVANGIFITGGTNFTTGVYVISSVSAGVSATVDRTCTTAAGSSGTANIGGPFATPGFAGGQAVASNGIFIKTGTYGCSSTSNVAGGRVTTADKQRWEGYGSLRTDRAAKPILQSTSNSMTIFSVLASTGGILCSVELKKGVGTTTVRGYVNSDPHIVQFCKATNLDNGGFRSQAANQLFFCEANGCDIGFDQGATTNEVNYAFCVAISCTTTGFKTGSSACSSYFFCIASGCVINFTGPSRAAMFSYCVAYGGSTSGFAVAGGVIMNSCVAVSNATGFVFTGSSGAGVLNQMFNCAGKNTAQYSGTADVNEGFITLSVDPFTNAAGNDFSLNNTAGGGALLKALGYPTSLPGLSTSTYPSVGAAIPAYTTGGCPLVGSGGLAG